MQINFSYTLMRKYIVILLTLLSLHPMSGQIIDTASIKVYYIEQFKEYVEKNQILSDEKVLEIGKRHTFYYGRWRKRRDEIADSITKIGGSFETLHRLCDKYPSAKSFFYFYNNYPTAGKRTVTDYAFKKFYYEEEITEPRWEITPGDTIILDYPCKRAITNYRGRVWTAYFTMQLPIAEGPWMLRGLPGLILYAKDDSGVFSFDCIDIKRADEPMRAPKLTKHIKVSRAEFRNMKREEARDILAFEKKMGLPGKAFGPDGRPLTYPERTALFMDNEE